MLSGKDSSYLLNIAVPLKIHYGGGGEKIETNRGREALSDRHQNLIDGCLGTHIPPKNFIKIINQNLVKFLHSYVIY